MKALVMWTSEKHKCKDSEKSLFGVSGDRGESEDWGVDVEVQR